MNGNNTTEMPSCNFCRANNCLYSLNGGSFNNQPGANIKDLQRGSNSQKITPVLVLIGKYVII